MKKVSGGYQYTQNGKTMTMVNLVNEMGSNPEALQFIKKQNQIMSLLQISVVLEEPS
jgi:hypothetical protein